jgi:hypothetical protein
VLKVGQLALLLVEIYLGEMRLRPGEPYLNMLKVIVHFLPPPCYEECNVISPALLFGSFVDVTFDARQYCIETSQNLHSTLYQTVCQ